MKKIKKSSQLLLFMLVIIFLLSACTQPAENGTKTSANTSSVSTTASTTEVTYTDAGTPRSETLIFEMFNGQWKGELVYNPYLSSCVDLGRGFRTCIWEALYDVDLETGEQICLLAESFPVALDDTFTKFEIKLRQGVKWSDGVDFTADDVVFTMEMLIAHPDLKYSSTFSSAIKSITKVDDYSVQIETNQKETRLSQLLGVLTGFAKFYPLPKHIWENVDPTTYPYTEIVGTGPYTLKEADTNGNYFLFEKREDSNNSATCIVFGEVVPKYCLHENFGDDDTAIMAAINNKVDLLYEATIENVQILLEQNSEASSWYETFPYGRTSHEPNGLLFNCGVDPLNKVNVRWALVLASNIEDTMMAGVSGSAKVSLIPLSSGDSITNKYTIPMLDWLANFTLSDGYKPFDDSYAQNIYNTLVEQGVEGLPADQDSLKAMFGLGWWKYDTQEAEKLLLDEGFTKDNNGKWLLPDGNPWQITIACVSGVEAERKAHAYEEAWKSFGIDAVVSATDQSSMQTAISQGTADCYMSWLNASGLADVASVIRTWHSSYIAPVGENTSGGYTYGACSRFSNNELCGIIDELVGLSADDPRADELITDYLELMVTNGVYFVEYGALKQCPVTTHYWTNFPSSEDPYCNNLWWFSNQKIMLTKIQPTGNQ